MKEERNDFILEIQFVRIILNKILMETSEIWLYFIQSVFVKKKIMYSTQKQKIILGSILTRYG